MFFSGVFLLFTNTNFLLAAAIVHRDFVSFASTCLLLFSCLALFLSLTAFFLRRLCLCVLPAPKNDG